MGSRMVLGGYDSGKAMRERLLSLFDLPLQKIPSNDVA